jgi:hypothetical protein
VTHSLFPILLSGMTLDQPFRNFSTFTDGRPLDRSAERLWQNISSHISSDGEIGSPQGASRAVISDK